MSRIKIHPGPPPDLRGIIGLPPGAQLIWAPADPANYSRPGPRAYRGAKRRQIAICYHTPEEHFDDTEVTPRVFQNPKHQASTGYYADSDGDLYQMVRDAHFAWGQGTRKWNTVQPRPAWWRDEYVSYNTCMLSIEIEGRAAEIGETFRPGEPQFQTVAAWSAHVCRRYGIPVNRVFHVAHSELSTHRRDPGADFPWGPLLAEVRRRIIQAESDALADRLKRLLAAA